MQKKGEKTMKREEWKRSYKRICCLLAAIGAGTALCGCSPGNGTQAVRRLEEVRFPAEPVYKNSEERWEAERNQSLPEAFLSAYSDFSYGTAAELLKDKRRIQPIHPWAFISPWRQRPQGAEGKPEKSSCPFWDMTQLQELAKDCKSSFEILYHVPNKKNRTGAGEEPHTSSLYSLQIANSLWADDSLPLKEAFAGRLSEYFYTDVFQGDLQSGEAGEAMAGWVKERTGGLIQPEPAPLPENVQLSLRNTIYFYDQWQDRFSPETTEEDVFYTDDGQEIVCDFMNRENGSTGFGKEKTLLPQSWH